MPNETKIKNLLTKGLSVKKMIFIEVFSMRKMKRVISIYLTMVRIFSLIVDFIFFIYSLGNKQRTLTFHRERNTLQQYIIYKHEKITANEYCKIVGVKLPVESDVNVIDLNGAKLPYNKEVKKDLYTLSSIIVDTFYIHLKCQGNYSADYVDRADEILTNENLKLEGSYLYKNIKKGMDITIKPGDVVFDLGAWIGDFSALASYYGATIYAFEPTPSTFKLLQETSKINKNITPIQFGVGATKESARIQLSSLSGSNRISQEGTVKIEITTIDDFVKENNIERVDFIKADIEGFEREMLKGASWVLRTMTPTLSLCTYHQPDDPEVLEGLILAANPHYKVMQREKKLYAWV